LSCKDCHLEFSIVKNRHLADKHPNNKHYHYRQVYWRMVQMCLIIIHNTLLFKHFILIVLCYICLKMATVLAFWSTQNNQNVIRENSMIMYVHFRLNLYLFVSVREKKIFIRFPIGSYLHFVPAGAAILHNQGSFHPSGFRYEYF
jgi:hypothetical protein